MEYSGATKFGETLDAMLLGRAKDDRFLIIDPSKVTWARNTSFLR
ncbi:hypothetical protein [Salipaludibacillus neizhouensis]|nr:hypothetical protein [Salipaludibacillus neizhouensis]